MYAALACTTAQWTCVCIGQVSQCWSQDCFIGFYLKWLMILCFTNGLLCQRRRASVSFLADTFLPCCPWKSMKAQISLRSSATSSSLVAQMLNSIFNTCSSILYFYYVIQNGTKCSEESRVQPRKLLPRSFASLWMTISVYPLIGGKGPCGGAPAGGTPLLNMPRIIPTQFIIVS